MAPRKVTTAQPPPRWPPQPGLAWSLHFQTSPRRCRLWQSLDRSPNESPGPGQCWPRCVLKVALGLLLEKSRKPEQDMAHVASSRERWSPWMGLELVT